jgi:predicted aspartyl protease
VLCVLALFREFDSIHVRSLWTLPASFACAVALLGAADPPLDPAAATLLALHEAYVGWQLGDGTFDTLRVEDTQGKLGTDGKLAGLETSTDLRRGIVNRRSHLNAQGLELDSGFTGSIFWSSNINGFTVPRYDDGRAVELAESIFFNEASTSLPATLLRTDAATNVAVLRETTPAGTKLDISENRTTGAYLSVTVATPDESDTLLVDGYDEIAPGKRMVTRWHRAGSRYRHEDKVTANPRLSDGDLHPPPSRASWTFGTNAPIRLEVTQDQIVLDAAVNGVRGRFLLDTGAAGMFVTRDFAARAKLEVVGETVLSGASGEARSKLAKAKTVAFADGSTLHDLILYTGLSAEGSDAGIIGYDLLAAALVDVDLDAGQMRIFDPTTSVPNGKDALVVLPDLRTGTPIVPAKLNGKFSTGVLFDTGNSAPALIAADWKGTVPMLIDPDPAKYLSTHRVVIDATGTTSEVECGQLERISMGQVSYDAAPTCMLPTLERTFSLVGFSFLKHFNYTFDYPEGKIYMSLRKFQQ